MERSLRCPDTGVDGLWRVRERDPLKGLDRMIPKNLIIFFLFILSNFFFFRPVSAQEREVGEGEHRGFIVNEGEQALKVSLIKPGQTLQVSFTPRWIPDQAGKANLRLDDQDGVRLRAATQNNPEVEPVFMEWTSNSEPRPKAYSIHIQGIGGAFPGEILGEYTLRIILWDQNDGDSGTDAPETFEKALFLPLSEPGNYLFGECFISGTADIYDIYKILIKPNHALTLRAQPLQWKRVGRKGQARFEFLNKSFKRLKEGANLFPQTSPFIVKVFHPRVRSDTKPALFYLLVKMEGEVSMVYALEAEIKEGR